MGLNLDMTNIAFTSGYKERRKKLDAELVPENLNERKKLEIAEGYSAERSLYSSNIGETIVYSPDGLEIYRYQSHDVSGDFLTLIDHSNGRKYLIFRIDLYGYGVFDIMDKKEFFHIPKESETFIWTEVFYNPLNDVLAVDGCFWACPYGINLLDFKNPMAETKWIDIHDKLYPRFESCIDIDFIRWDGTLLIVKAYEVTELDGIEKETPRELIIDEARYMEWLL